MGLFTKDKKLKFKEVPSTPEQDHARNFLMDLMGRNIKFPTQKIAGLTDSELNVQDQIKSYLSTIGGDFDLSTNYFRDVLNDDYNPETSRYYQGIRGQLDTQKDEAEAGVRRSAQKAGSARSTPALGIEQRTGQDYDFQKDKILGALLQDERNFKAQAGQALPNLRGQQLGQLGAADQIASKPRQLEQARMDAAYQKIVNDLLAPYKYQAGIAESILNEQSYQGYSTGGGLTDFGFMTQTVASAIPFSSAGNNNTSGGPSQISSGANTYNTK